MFAWPGSEWEQSLNRTVEQRSLLSSTVLHWFPVAAPGTVAILLFLSELQYLASPVGSVNF